MSTPMPTIPTRALARERGLVAERRGWLGTTDLLAKEPEREELGLAFVVRALVQTRTFLDREDDLGTGLVARLVQAASQMPSRRFQASSWQCVTNVIERRPRTCDACTFKPGLQLCQACEGSKEIRDANGNESRPCPGCNATGYVKCARCDGDRRIQRVVVRTYEDHVAELDHVFLPHLPPTLHEQISERLLGIDELPTVLAVDLDKPSTVPLGGYRTGSAVSPPRFHGIEAGLPFVDAKQTLARLASNGTFLERAIQCHAVPMLTLTYGRTRVVILSLGEALSLLMGDAEDD